jgi:pilus assembly protein Flp/PilA
MLEIHRIMTHFCRSTMINSLKKSIVEFLAEEDGPTAVEYAVMLGLICAVCIASVNFMAAKTTESFDSSKTAIEAAN